MLNVNEIFESISGEAGGFPQGTWCTFVRLQGCNLNCSWCDTPKGQSTEQNQFMSIQQVLTAVEEFGNKHILITGGEPLIQRLHVRELISELQSSGYEVQVETNGSQVIPYIYGVHWVVDYKCPSSGMARKMLPLLAFRTLAEAQEGGNFFIKFVVADDIDLGFALAAILDLVDTGWRRKIIISPVDADGSKISSMVRKIKEKGKEDEINYLDQIIFSVQLHKIVGMP